MSERYELKPCPYCGDYGAEVAESSVLSVFGGFKKAVFCNLCFAEGPTAESVANAVAAWNRRAASPADRVEPEPRKFNEIGYLCHGSARISLKCNRSAIDLFVSRAIENLPLMEAMSATPPAAEE